MADSFVICGPTASGKSDAAIEIAKRLRGFVISVDSRQVYKGLDIGSGKIAGDFVPADKDIPFDHYLSEGVVHFGLDCFEVTERVTVIRFLDYLKPLLSWLNSIRAVKILCGGSGFWLDVVSERIKLPSTSYNPGLRDQLNKLEAVELFQELLRIDPLLANKIDRNNKHRLIRAVEISTEFGRRPMIEHGNNNYLWFGINPGKDKLRKLINWRLRSRLAQGLIEEVKTLIENGISIDRLKDLGLEYSLSTSFLLGELTFEEYKTRLERDIFRFAKRQLTWFKRHKDITWFESASDLLEHFRI